MTNATQPKPNPLPAILVYGTPSGPALTQASWFRAEDKEAVKAAAEELKFSVIELHTDADRALAAGAHEGVLKGSGRMIVGSVSAEVYRRIEEHVRKGAGAPDPSKPDRRRGGDDAKSMSEQTKNLPGPRRHWRPSKPDPASATDRLGCVSGRRVGARDYWNESGEFEGLLARHHQRIENGDFTLDGPTTPKYPPLKIAREKRRCPAPRVPRYAQVARASESPKTIIILFASGRPSGRPSSFRRRRTRRAPSHPQPQETKP